jgi:RND family efflux transporter MFP subunit
MLRRSFPFRTLLACLVAGALLLGASACGGGAADEENAESAEAAEGQEGEQAASQDDGGKDGDAEQETESKPKKEPVTSVYVSQVARGDLVIPIMAEGSVRARHAADIKFEIAGRLEKIWVREGQRVRKGQVLATLDDREYRLALEEARSRFLQGLGQLAVEEDGYGAKGAERVLEEEMAGLKQLELDGAITREQRLDRELELGMEAVRNGAYRRELLEVRSGLSTARADIARLELDLERTVIHAPFSGVITGLELTSKERVQVGQLLARLVDDVNLEADVGVLESDLAGLVEGKAARLTVPALGETFALEVDVVSPEIDDTSRTCSALIRLKSKDGRVKPGMFVRAAIAGEVHPNTRIVPREAILTRDGRPMLFRVEEDRAKWVYVELGKRNEHVVEIERIVQGGPLEEGTLVIVDNHLTLTHDAKVKVRKTVPIHDPWVDEAEQE